MLKTKMKGKILSLFTAFAMLASLLPGLPAGVTALAATTNTDSAFTVTTEDGSCSYSDNVLTISSGGTYTIYQTGGVGTATSDTIKITATDSDVTINLQGVNIESSSTAPFLIDSSSTANVTIALSDTNTLKATGDNYAGLQKGTSDAYSLTITSASGDGETSGTLTATGGSYGAGIGGGKNGAGSNITINGGTIEAQGGLGGAGIGGGYQGAGNYITVNGGAITTQGAEAAWESAAAVTAVTACTLQ